jgi:alkanesulfonate monooxygenase SsuD/methylene tetrahydromethanopterin reductase-like flavin-dependent oxidoreductase (luciferase family)
MVTPLPRRRPVKVARETATLDWLSGGRLTLGVGTGGDSFAHEFSKTGKQLNDRARGQMLDEALEILTTARVHPALPRGSGGASGRSRARRRLRYRADHA